MGKRYKVLGLTGDWPSHHFFKKGESWYISTDEFMRTIEKFKNVYQDLYTWEEK